MTFFGMTGFEFTEFLSYLVTVVGLPCAIVAFIVENQHERQNEDEELNQRLSDQYTEFLKLVLENGDLQILRRQSTESLSDEQQERKYALFGILIALLERAFIMIYEEQMSKHRRRLWLSWEDYVREWCRRSDFRAVLPSLLEGEDEDFSRYIVKVAHEEEVKKRP